LFGHFSCTLVSYCLYMFLYIVLPLNYVNAIYDYDLPQVKGGEDIQVYHKKGMEQQVSYLIKEFS
jgi:hypothetical protein